MCPTFHPQLEICRSRWFPGFHNDFDMSLFRHKDDKDGVVATVAYVLHDDLCVQGRASRVLLVGYPTGWWGKGAGDLYPLTGSNHSDT